MRRNLILAGMGATLAFGGGLLFGVQPQTSLNPDTGLLVKGNNIFAVDLYQNLSKEEGNLFFSPYSISNALAMTYGGAKTKTATDMAGALRFPFDGSRLHPAFSDLVKELNRAGQPRKYQLAIANRLWGQKDYGFLPDFLQLSKDAYGAGLQELDFEGNSEQARRTINDWVAKETQDKIKDLLAEGSLAGDTRLVLTNAIYFKAAWVAAFSAGATKKEDFNVSGTKKVTVDMMHHSESWNLLENDSFQLLELPYEQRELTMLVILPRKVDGLSELEKELTADNLQDWIGKMKRHQVNLSLPKFTFTSEFKLKDVLSEMGMSVAFSGNADFSGMTTREKLFIDAVIHKAFVAVDEKGTEAAAATAVTIRPTSAGVGKEATVLVDHPFIFLIRDNRTGSVLFMGRVVNP